MKEKRKGKNLSVEWAFHKRTGDMLEITAIAIIYRPLKA